MAVTEVQLDFVTLGMFIIDEIHFPPPRKPEIDVLGGAGPWGIFGARLFRPSPSSKTIGWIVHKGSDFPQTIDEQIRSWDTSCNFIDTPERLTTRSWNSYGHEEARAFKYTTPKLRIDETQLSDRQILAKSFHLICTPTRCINLVSGILKRREDILKAREPGQEGHDTSKALFVWEPVPDACKPEELQNAIEALKYVDVISPNHQELAGFFGERGALDDDGIKRTRDYTERLMRAWPAGRGLAVVRCGEAGCLWLDNEDKDSAITPQILKPYHRPDGRSSDLGDPSQVVDPTGAGNAFLGGFCAGMVDSNTLDRHGLVLHAVQCGIVAASFAIEQVGFPELGTQQGHECWNRDFVSRRLKSLKSDST